MKTQKGASIIEVLLTMLVITLTVSSLLKALKIPFSLLSKSEFNLPFLKYDLNACQKREKRGLRIIECKSPTNPQAKISLVE